MSRIFRIALIPKFFRLLRIIKPLIYRYASVKFRFPLAGITIVAGITAVAGMMPFFTALISSAQASSTGQQISNEAHLGLTELFRTESYYDYNLYWSFIKVGTAQLKFSVQNAESSDSDPRPKFVIHFTAQSDPILNSFYPVTSKIESTLLVENLKPHYYQKHLKQGNENEHSILYFDWEKEKIFETKNGIASDPIDAVEGCQDPLSLILAICQNDFQNNPYHEQSVTDGGKIIELKSQLSGTEPVNSSVGSFHSQRIAIETHDLRGVFKKSPDANLFLFLHRLNDASPALPIKIQSKVTIGSFYAVLSGGMHQGLPIRGIKAKKTSPTIHSRERIFRKFK